MTLETAQSLAAVIAVATLVWIAVELIARALWWLLLKSPTRNP